MAEPPTMVDTVEAAAILGKSRDTVLRMAAKGRLKVAFEGSNFRLFYREEVEQMAAALRVVKGQTEASA